MFPGNERSARKKAGLASPAPGLTRSSITQVVQEARNIRSAQSEPWDATHRRTALVIHPENFQTASSPCMVRCDAALSGRSPSCCTARRTYECMECSQCAPVISTMHATRCKRDFLFPPRSRRLHQSNVLCSVAVDGAPSCSTKSPSIEMMEKKSKKKKERKK